MKIKNLMDFLNVEQGDGQSGRGRVSSSDDEKVIYIENARLETVEEQAERKNELLAYGTQWADQSIGSLLIDLGKLDEDEVQRVVEHQQSKGLYFGEAAVDLKLVDYEDILHALSVQFGYTFDKDESFLSKDIAMAYSPFGEQAEEFRAIRSQLLNNWLTPNQKTLAIVSPQTNEGRSYVAANLAMAFSQLGRPTLLIDADMRAPRQHEIFNVPRKIGLSMLLAGRVKMQDLNVLPDTLSNYKHLSILGSGAVPPNPAELLSKNTFALILRELKKYFDIIIIDTPSANYQSDVISIASNAGGALMVARGGHSTMEATKNLKSLLSRSEIVIAGAVLNQY